MYIINIIKCNIYIYTIVCIIYIWYLYIGFLWSFWWSSHGPSILWLKLLYLRGHWWWKTIGINRWNWTKMSLQFRQKGRWWLEPWNFEWLSRNSWEWNVIIPTDELHHFSEGLKPPTSHVVQEVHKASRKSSNVTAVLLILGECRPWSNYGYNYGILSPITLGYEALKRHGESSCS